MADPETPNFTEEEPCPCGGECDRDCDTCGDDCDCKKGRDTET